MINQWLSKDLWIICAGFMAAMHIGKLPPAVAVLTSEMGITLVQAGFLLSLVQCAGMLCALALGSSIAHIGFKRCILIGLFLLVLGSSLGALAPSIAVLMGSRVIEGFGFLLITLTAPAFIHELVPPAQLQTKIGLWSSYMGTGFGLSLLCAPFIIHYLSWQALWLGLAGLSVMLWLAVWRWIPDVAGRTQSHRALPLIKATLKHPPAWGLACLFALYTGQWFSLVGFLPTIYQQHQISVSHTGFLTASIALVNAVGTFGCGILLQRGFRPQYLIQFGFAVMLFTAASFFIFQNSLAFSYQFVLVFYFSLFGGFVAASIFSQAIHFSIHAAAISMTVGLVLQLSATSQFFMPPLIASIVSTTQSWFWVGVFMAVLSAFAICICQLVFQTKQVLKDSSALDGSKNLPDRSS